MLNDIILRHCNVMRSHEIVSESLRCTNIVNLVLHDNVISLTISVFWSVPVVVVVASACVCVCVCVCVVHNGIAFHCSTPRAVDWCGNSVPLLSLLLYWKMMSSVSYNERS